MEVTNKNTDKIVKALRPNEKLSSATKKVLSNEMQQHLPVSHVHF